MDESLLNRRDTLLLLDLLLDLGDLKAVSTSPFTSSTPITKRLFNITLHLFSSSAALSSIIRLALIVFVENVETQTLGIKHQPVLGASLLKLSSDQSSVLDLLELQVGLVLLDGLTNQFGRAGLTLCLDNHGLLLLSCLVDNEGSSLGLLLGNLLGLNGGCEFGREGKRDIVQKNVESGSSSSKVLSHQSSDVLSLCDELTGIELGNNTLENLVNNRRQHTLIVVGA
ncbi:hypothetical protein HG531_014030 [Fusarium graminearum]|nr:hypothetical protein HG531_014030 [Fusarium graminearum]